MPEPRRRFHLTPWQTGMAAIGLAVGAVAGVALLILSGLTDPHPIGQRAVSDTFTEPGAWQPLSPDPAVSLSGDEGAYTVRLGQPGHAVRIAGPHVISVPGSVLLTARQTGGSPDLRYGLWWGQPGQAWLFEITSEGYVGVQHGDQWVRPLKRFPHVRPAGQDNLFEVDIQSGWLLLRLNQEIVQRIDADSPPTLTAGLAAESATGPAAVSFERFEVWR